MSTLNTMKDLLVHQLRELYSAERQLLEAQPRIVRQAHSDSLRLALLSHMKETEEHIARLEQALSQLLASPGGMPSQGMKGLLLEGQHLLELRGDPVVRDAGIIAAAQRIEHYEIAAYGTVCDHARRLGHHEIANMLELTLDEERAADLKLNNLAEDDINDAAINHSSGSARGELATH